MDMYAFLATMDPMGSICEIHEIVDAVLYLEGAGDESFLVHLNRYLLILRVLTL
jgi:hypothetical protein